MVIHPRPAHARPRPPLAAAGQAGHGARPAAATSPAGSPPTRSTCSPRPRSSAARRASRARREALLLTPLHEYSHLVIGARSTRTCRRRSRPATFRRYVRRAWLCEGAATWLSGQTGHLRGGDRAPAAGGRPPGLPALHRATPSCSAARCSRCSRRRRGPRRPSSWPPRASAVRDRPAIERAFGRPAAAVERDWRDYLESLGAGG